MANFKHRVIAIDLNDNTLTCMKCGVVPIGWKTAKGEKVPRCSVALKESRAGYSGRWESKKGPHGLTVLEARLYRSNKPCAICGKPPGKQRDGKDSHHVDHDHKTGVIRGVLCGSCNQRIGWFEKNSDMITKYLGL